MTTTNIDIEKANQVEALIFAAKEPIGIDTILEVINEAEDGTYIEEDIEQIVQYLMIKYSDNQNAFEIKEISDGLVFLTKPTYDKILSIYLKKTEVKKLSKAAMEALSIIAYKQPITKSEIEQIRGVNSDYAIQKLLDRDLIDIIGRNDGPGRSLIYKTSQIFLDYFGLKSMADLPTLKEISPEVNSIGLTDAGLEA
jgi:segregation and condensation protein B